MSLRVDNRAKIVRLPVTLQGLFTGRYAVASGRRIFSARWKTAEIRAIQTRQLDNPVGMLRDESRNLWYFHDKLYWEDDRLPADDVKALVLQRERKERHRLNTARSLMEAETAGKSSRVPIPQDLRRAVFERDAGRCVECGSTFDLQYDHVLPVKLGGATTLENLQLLCAECNRRKSDNL